MDPHKLDFEMIPFAWSLYENGPLCYMYVSLGAMDPRCKICIFMGKTDPKAPKHKQQVCSIFTYCSAPSPSLRLKN